MPSVVRAGDTFVSVPALIGALKDLFDTRKCTSHQYWTANTAARVLQKYVVDEPTKVSHKHIEFEEDGYTVHGLIEYFDDGTAHFRSLFKE